MSFSDWWRKHVWKILFLLAKSFFVYDTFNLALQVVFLLHKKSLEVPKWLRCRKSSMIYGDFKNSIFEGVCLFQTEIYSIVAFWSKFSRPGCPSLVGLCCSSSKYLENVPKSTFYYYFFDYFSNCIAVIYNVI